MSVYLIEFHYEGITDGIPSPLPYSRVASKICMSYDRRIEKILTKANLKWRHAYSWPDGSIYKYVEFDGIWDSLLNVLLPLFSNKPWQWPGRLQVDLSIRDPEDESQSMYQYFEVTTLREYMDEL